MVSNEKYSICDIMKGNTSVIIQKMESQIPVNFQIYSDMYKEYLHMIDDLFGTCYLSEKEFFDKMNIDDRILKIMSSYGKTYTEIYSNQVENYSSFLKWYSKMRTSGTRSYDKFAHVMMDSYAKIISDFSKKFQF
ncbi:MAG: hypothetical protein IIA19_06460 [Thaumarchaeota archaeon]|nr:hypothetical protein [Nitrososphaerota archaeon]